MLVVAQQTEGPCSPMQRKVRGLQFHNSLLRVRSSASAESANTATVRKKTAAEGEVVSGWTELELKQF